MVTDARGFPQLAPSSRRTAIRKEIVYERDSMTNNAVRSNLDQLTHKRMRLNLGTRSDFYSSLYLDEWADKAIVSQDAFVNIRRFDDADSLTANNVPNLRFPVRGCRQGQG